MTRILLALALALLLVCCLFGVRKHGRHRDSTARRQFQHTHPCPSTGKKTGACPGFIVDHVVPLACGGPDRPSNMQWQTQAEAKAKDRWERKGCAK